VDLLHTISELQPKKAADGEEAAETVVLRTAKGLEDNCPPVWEMRVVKEKMSSRSDPDPLKTVLFQEIDRYNKLLKRLHVDLRELQLGVQGLTVITPALEAVADSALAGKVPGAWMFAYPSLKPLGAWMPDLVARCTQFTDWADTAMPKCFWLSGFTYPSGMLTAMLQTTARKNGLAIDTLNYEFPIINQEESNIAQHPKEGAYIKGIYLEGARWDFEKGCLTDSMPMELFCPMPIIHFKPSESKKKSSKGVYSCPLYMYPIRTGSRERPSFMIACDVKSGSQDSDFWVKRGTALLLSLAS